MKKLCFLVAFVIATKLHAAVFTYSFTGSTGNEATFAVDAQPDNATASSFSRGSGVGASSGAGTFSANNWTTGSVIDSNDYFSFTLSPDSGFGATLTSITFDERRSGTGIREWSVRSSLDGFADDIVTSTVPDTTDTRTDQTVNLSSSFEDLTSAIEFRFYGYQAESGAGTWRLDNVTLFGAITSVPEPGVYGLVYAVFLLGFMCMRKK